MQQACLRSLSRHNSGIAMRDRSRLTKPCSRRLDSTYIISISECLHHYIKNTLEARRLQIRPHNQDMSFLVFFLSKVQPKDVHWR
ncbi:hypothetical protein B0T12DRAFT_132122 [Alternaria alternata]|nr:hypothetical protein B0T12DRAFT_132122 [Alternaria alternata]